MLRHHLKDTKIKKRFIEQQTVKNIKKLICILYAMLKIVQSKLVLKQKVALEK